MALRVTPGNHQIPDNITMNKSCHEIYGITLSLSMTPAPTGSNLSILIFFAI